LNNIVGSKKHRPTLFGALSYLQFYRLDDTGYPNDTGLIVSVPFGTLLSRAQNFPVVNPMGRHLSDGASLFQFSAFDSTLNVDQLWYHIPRLADHLESSVRDSINAHIARMNVAGISTDEVIVQPPTVTSVLMIKFSFPSGDAPA